jgi:ubiquinone/menaquinone biosynthesis C-methylase UbiE
MEVQPFEKWAVNTFSPLYLRAYVLPRLWRLMGDVPGTRGLGIGAGPGVETFAIARRYWGRHLIAVDYDAAQVERARARLARQQGLPSHVTFEQGDATALAFPAESFDFAYALNVLHHIAEYPRALAEMHRVLKPGGRLYIQDLSREFLGLPVVRGLFPAEALFTAEDLREELSKAGHVIEHLTGRWVVFVRALKPREGWP